MFEWILFDADHTLFDFDRSAAESLAHTMQCHGLVHHEDHWDLYNTINKQCWNAYENGEIDRDTMRTRRFTLFFDQIGAATSVNLELFAHEYLCGLPTRPYFIEGAIDLINILHGRFHLGIITNGLSEVQRPRLEATGVDKLFDIIVVSGEIGLMKPHHAFFDHAYELMHRPEKEKVLVVGDSLNADIRGGKEFGFQTCWYNPDKIAKDVQVVPDYEIETLEDLFPLVGL